MRNIVNLPEGRVAFSFIDTSSRATFQKITQSYCLCFNDEGKILVGKRDHHTFRNYGLPGGTIEEGETPEDALHRELMEEVNVVLGDFKLLGAQHCEFLDTDKEPIIQLRYVGIIKELQSLTVDPDTGYMWERIFVEPEKVNEYLGWGSIGDHIAKRAKQWFIRRNDDREN